MDKPTDLDKWDDIIRGEGFYARIGWYDEAEQEEPTHDPARNGPCIVCDKPLVPPIKTISLMAVEGAIASYFYRAHKACYEANPQAGDDKAWELIELRGAAR